MFVFLLDASGDAPLGGAAACFFPAANSRAKKDESDNRQIAFCLNYRLAPSRPPALLVSTYKSVVQRRKFGKYALANDNYVQRRPRRSRIIAN